MPSAVQLVQRQSSCRRRHLATHPLLRSLSCALDHRRYLAHTDVASQQHPQASLDAAIAGVPFHQQGQARSCELLVRLRWFLLGGQGAFQCGLPFPFPGVERLTRDLMAPTHLTHDSVSSLLGQQFAHPLDSLARCARMGMNHWFLPDGGTVRFSLPYPLREVFGNSFLSHCQVLSSFFEPCLSLTAMP